MRGLRGGLVVATVVSATWLPVTGSAAATTYDAGTEAEWRAAVEAASADGTGPQVIQITADFAISTAGSPLYHGDQDLTVDGDGHVVSGSAADTGFLHSISLDGLVTIRDLTVRDFHLVNSNHAVTVASRGEVDHVTFTDNDTVFDGAALGAQYQVTVHDSTFLRNHAGRYGGAVDGFGITIEDSTFEGNVADDQCGAAVLYGGSEPSGTITGSTFTENRAEGGTDGVGGAICAIHGHLADNRFVANHADGRGGAVFTYDAPIERTTFTANTSDDGGGAVHAGVLDVDDSTFAANVAPTGGAAQAEKAVSSGTASVDVTNSTFTGNRSTVTGGVLDNSGTFAGSTRLRYVTFSGNRSVGPGADVSAGADGMTVYGTVFTDPEGAPSCASAGPVRSSYSYATDGSCALVGPGDVQDGPSPGLGPLADNGGPTDTMAPLTGSPLLEAIPLDACAADLLVDQRGLSRPRDSDETTPDYGCDVGAVELGAERPPPTPTTTTSTIPSSTTSTTSTTAPTGVGGAPVARPTARQPAFTG